MGLSFVSELISLKLKLIGVVKTGFKIIIHTECCKSAGINRFLCQKVIAKKKEPGCILQIILCLSQKKILCTCYICVVLIFLITSINELFKLRILGLQVATCVIFLFDN